MLVTYFLFALSCLITNCSGIIDIDKYLKTCDRTALDVNECMVDAIRDGLARLCDGIKNLGVPPIDPYHQQELRVEYKNYQIMATMIMRDIYVKGLRHAKVLKARLRADDDNFHLEVDMISPQIFVNGTYNGLGSYNSLKVNASGTFNTTMHDVVYTWKLDGKPERKNNETYMKIYDFYMRPDVGSLESFLTNDNPASKEIIDFANNFANANWKSLYRELLPFAQQNWNKIGIRVANKIFLKVPYHQLFPANY